MIQLQLARMQLRGQYGQLALAIGVIALGVALATGVLLANDALRSSFEDSLGALSGRADLEVFAAGGGTLDERVLEEVLQRPETAAAAPLLMGAATVVGGLEVKVAVVGIDMLSDANIRIYDADPAQNSGIEDPLVFLNQQDSVIVPEALARELGLERGSRIELQTSTGRPTLTVRGILLGSGVGLAHGGRTVIMDLYAAQEALGLPGRVSRVDVVLAEGVDGRELAGRLEDVFPAHVAVELTAALQERRRSLVAGFQTMLDIISLLGLVLAGLITANRVATVYQERLWEIGVLRGLGWPPRVLLRSLLIEAALFSCIGAAVGGLLGIAFAVFMVSPIADAMTLNFQQTVATPAIAVAPGPILLAGSAGVISGVVGAVMPALGVARLPISVVMSRKRRRESRPDRVLVRATRVAAALAAVALLALHYLAGPGPALGVGIIAALIVASCLLLQPLLVALGGAFGLVFGGASQIGAKDQGRAPTRAVGAALVLMAGIAVVVWIGFMAESFQHYVVDTLTHGRVGADLIVDGSVDGFSKGPIEPKLADTALQELLDVPGVEAVGASLNAVSRHPETGILAVDEPRLRNTGFGDWDLEPGAEAGALNSVAQGRGVLVNRQLVINRGLRVGDTIRLMTPTGPLELPVVGVGGSSIISQGGDVVMSLTTYRRYWNDPSFHQALLLLSPGASGVDVRRAVLHHLGDRYRLRVIDQDGLAEWIRDSVRQGFRFTDALVFLTLAVVLIGTGDALAADVLERTREIGAMRAFGYTPSALSGMVIVQALSIGVAGSALGIIVGIGISIAFVEGLLPSILGWQLRLYPAYFTPAGGLALGIVACLIGALPPAVRTARLSPAQALRYE
ncbi:MAG: ABC transporter permease [Candidatus Binatia bacterium]|nr:ABC transporter permease [Candidatus Binatia bacterium]